MAVKAISTGGLNRNGTWMKDKRPIPVTDGISLLSRSLQQKRDAAESLDRKRRERRHAAIKASLNKNPKMTRPEDQKIVATNLGEILDRLEHGGRGKKEAVLRAANMGEDGDSTKQLYWYTLPTGCPAPEKRISTLVKRLAGYVKLAQIAADMAGWDERGILIELFRGSTYDASGPVPDLPDYIFALDEIFDGLNSWLARKTKIQWYYEMLRKFPVWDDWGNFVVNQATSPLLDDSGHSPAFYGKAIPGIRLYRFLCAELPVEFASDRGESFGDDPNDPPPRGAIEHLTLQHYFDVRLGLAPVDASGNIRLVFDQRRVIELWQVQEPAKPKWRAYAPISFPFKRKLRRNVMAKWSGMDFHGAFDPPTAIVDEIDDTFDEIGLFGGSIRFPTLKNDSIPPNELFERAISEDDALLRACQDQFVDEVEPSTCKQYLDRKMDECIRCNWNLLSRPLECPADTIAARIESAFHYDEIEDRIDTLLQKAIEDRCSLLDRCLERRNTLIAEEKQKLFSRWDEGSE